jgi:hypothetical protein
LVYNVKMKITILLTLIAISVAMNCPLAPNAQSTCYSGVFTATPDADKVAQDMSYSHSYNSALSQIPQLCLSTLFAQFRCQRISEPKRKLNPIAGGDQPSDSAEFPGESADSCLQHLVTD